LTVDRALPLGGAFARAVAALLDDGDAVNASC
jgi:hypothetical protein